MTTTIEFITALFYEVDEQMGAIPKHPEAHLWPSEVVTLGLLVGLTSGGGVYYLHAAAIAFGCGLLTSYLLSIAWVFQARTWQNPAVEFGLFTLIGGIGLLGNGVCLWFFTEYAHLHYLCSKMVSGLFVFLWNFVAKKWSVT